MSNKHAPSSDPRDLARALIKDPNAYIDETAIMLVTQALINHKTFDEMPMIQEQGLHGLQHPSLFVEKQTIRQRNGQTVTKFTTPARRPDQAKIMTKRGIQILNVRNNHWVAAQKLQDGEATPGELILIWDNSRNGKTDVDRIVAEQCYLLFGNQHIRLEYASCGQQVQQTHCAAFCLAVTVEFWFGSLHEGISFQENQYRHHLLRLFDFSGEAFRCLPHNSIVFPKEPHHQLRSVTKNKRKQEQASSLLAAHVAETPPTAAMPPSVQPPSLARPSQLAPAHNHSTKRKQDDAFADPPFTDASSAASSALSLRKLKQKKRKQIQRAKLSKEQKEDIQAINTSKRAEKRKTLSDEQKRSTKTYDNGRKQAKNNVKKSRQEELLQTFDPLEDPAILDPSVYNMHECCPQKALALLHSNTALGSHYNLHALSHKAGLTDEQATTLLHKAQSDLEATATAIECTQDEVWERCQNAFGLPRPLVSCVACGLYDHKFEYVEQEQKQQYTKHSVWDDLCLPLRFSSSLDQDRIARIARAATKVGRHGISFDHVFSWCDVTDADKHTTRFHLHPELVDQNDQAIWLCSTCCASLQQKTRPKRSIAGGKDYGDFRRVGINDEPSMLEVLSFSAARAYMHVINLSGANGGHGKHPTLRAQVITFPQQVPQEALTNLPNVSVFNSIALCFVGPQSQLEPQLNKALPFGPSLRYRHSLVLDILHALQCIEHPAYVNMTIDVTEKNAEAMEEEIKQLYRNTKLIDDVVLRAVDVRMKSGDQSAALPQADASYGTHNEPPTIADDANIVVENVMIAPEDALPLFSHSFNETQQPSSSSSSSSTSSSSSSSTTPSTQHPSAAVTKSPVQQYVQSIRALLAKPGQQESEIILPRNQTAYNDYTENSKQLVNNFPHLFPLGIAPGISQTLTVTDMRHTLLQYNPCLGKCPQFIFLIFNQWQRQHASKGVAAAVKNNTADFNWFLEQANDPSFPSRLQQCDDNPQGQNEKALLKKLKSVVTVSASKIPWTNEARRARKAEFYAMVRHYGLPVMFNTISPDPIGHAMGLLRMKPCRNNDQVENPMYWHQAVNQLLQSVTPSQALQLSMEHPAIQAESYVQMIQTHFTQFHGLPYRESTRRTISRYRRPPGGFGCPVSVGGVTENNSKGANHWHEISMGGWPSWLMDAANNIPELRPCLAKLLESRTIAQGDPLHHVQSILRRMAGFSPYRAAWLTTPVAELTPDQRHMHKQNALDRTQIHNHGSRCHKKPYGTDRCAQGYERPMRPKTVPSQYNGEAFVDLPSLAHVQSSPCATKVPLEQRPAQTPATLPTSSVSAPFPSTPPTNLYTAPLHVRTADEEKLIDDYLANPNNQSKVNNNFHLAMQYSDLKCLNQGEELQDQVVNYVLEMIQKRGMDAEALSGSSSVQPLKIRCYNTFFMTQLTTKGYEEVVNWKTKAQIQFSKIDLLLIPVHVLPQFGKQRHWWLATVNFRSCEIRSLDSAGNTTHAVELEHVYRYVQTEYGKELGMKDYDMSLWTKDVMCCPRQHNQFDCGMFLLQNANYLSAGYPLHFQQKDMPSMRRNAVLEIVKNTLFLQLAAHNTASPSPHPTIPSPASSTCLSCSPIMPWMLDDSTARPDLSSMSHALPNGPLRPFRLYINGADMHDDFFLSDSPICSNKTALVTGQDTAVLPSLQPLPNAVGTPPNSHPADNSNYNTTSMPTDAVHREEDPTSIQPKTIQELVNTPTIATQVVTPSTIAQPPDDAVASSNTICKQEFPVCNNGNAIDPIEEDVRQRSYGKKRWLLYECIRLKNCTALPCHEPIVVTELIRPPIDFTTEVTDILKSNDRDDSKEMTHYSPKKNTAAGVEEVGRAVRMWQEAVPSLSHSAENPRHDLIESLHALYAAVSEGRLVSKKHMLRLLNLLPQQYKTNMVAAISRRNGKVTESSSTLLAWLGCNIASYSLTNNIAAAVSVYYIIQYITKDQRKIESLAAIALACKKRIDNNPSVALNTGTKERTAQHWLTRIVNKLNGTGEYDLPFVTSVVLGLEAEEFTDSFCTLNVHHALEYYRLEAQGNKPLPSDDESTDEEEEEEHDDFVDFENDGGNNSSAKLVYTNGQWMIPNVFIAWVHRPEEFKSFSLYEFACTVTIALLPKNEKEAVTADESIVGSSTNEKEESRKAATVWNLSPTCPLAKTHGIQLRRKQVIPKIFPRPKTPALLPLGETPNRAQSKRRSEFAKYALLLFDHWDITMKRGDKLTWDRLEYCMKVWQQGGFQSRVRWHWVNNLMVGISPSEDDKRITLQHRNRGAQAWATLGKDPERLFLRPMTATTTGDVAEDCDDEEYQTLQAQVDEALDQLDDARPASDASISRSISAQEKQLEYCGAIIALNDKILSGSENERQPQEQARGEVNPKTYMHAAALQDLTSKAKSIKENEPSPSFPQSMPTAGESRRSAEGTNQQSNRSAQEAGFTFNTYQNMALQRARACFLPGTPQQFLSHFGGPGCGKSRVIQTIIAEATAKGFHTMAMAPTAAAATQMTGRNEPTIATTIHTATGMGCYKNISGKKPGKGKNAKALQVKAMLQVRWNPEKICLLIVDEIGFTGCDLWVAIDECAQEVMKCKKPFGGLHVLIFGDGFQLGQPGENISLFKALCRSYFFDKESKEKKELTETQERAANLFHLFNKIEFKTNERCKQHPEWVTLLDNLRCETLGEFPLQKYLLPLLPRMELTTADYRNRPEWKSTTISAAGNLMKSFYIKSKAPDLAKQLQTIVIRWRRPVQVAKGQDINKLLPSELDSLYNNYPLLYDYFIHGAEATLLENVNVDRGVVNGSTVILDSLTLANGSADSAKLDATYPWGTTVTLDAPPLSVNYKFRDNHNVKEWEKETLVLGDAVLPSLGTFRLKKELTLLYENRYGETALIKGAYYLYHNYSLDISSTFHKLQGANKDPCVGDLNEPLRPQKIDYGSVLVLISRVKHGDNVKIIPSTKTANKWAHLEYLQPCQEMLVWMAAHNEKGDIDDEKGKLALQQHLALEKKRVEKATAQKREGSKKKKTTKKM